MRELGIAQIFARPPQAKGRVKRMAGTFQTAWSVNSGWREPAPWSRPTSCWRTSCPRFNAQFRVPAQQAQAAYRSLDLSLHLDGSSASSTRAKWPGTTHSSTNYAPCNYFQPKTGPAMPVSGGGAGKERRTAHGPIRRGGVPHQEAPPKAGALRAAQGALRQPRNWPKWSRT